MQIVTDPPDLDMPRDSVPETAGCGLALRHLLLHLKPLNRALKSAAAIRAEGNGLLLQAAPHAAAITDQHVRQLFAAVERLADGFSTSGAALTLTAVERRLEDQLRQAADATGRTLPLDDLALALDLSALEVDALLVCAAPQLQNSYERLYAFIHDDVNRRAPSLELMVLLLAPDLDGAMALRDVLAMPGKLCCHGLIRIIDAPANHLHRAFALGDGVLPALTTQGIDWAARFPDPAGVSVSDAVSLDVLPDADRLNRIAARLIFPGDTMVGLWGRSRDGVDDAVAALARAAGRPLRRLGSGDAAAISSAFATARALDALLWIETDGFNGAGQDGEVHRLAEVLADARQDIVLTGAVPWSPLRVLERKTLIDLQLTAPTEAQREALWQAAVPEAAAETRALLASLFQISPLEMRIAATAARGQAGEAGGFDAALLRACHALGLRRCNDFATAILPRRQPEDLILPAALHRQVLEIAAFYRGRGVVDEQWGFGRLLGSGGMKVLLTGDSGTGKTAAAEVIAAQLGADQILMKVHLATVVSKWVGETEKNLDAVFHQAEESNALLFFDEADALFCKRGEVERGADRYANLEVGFLLQRLETFTGLAILASNHKDQIDEAFMRRFQVVLHFPRPTAAERKRLWSMALPSAAPLDPDIDIDVLQQLDLTGAGIVSAARTAALLALQARGTAAKIGMADLVEAVSRQFQYEARLLPTAQLGPYAALLGKVA